MYLRLICSLALGSFAMGLLLTAPADAQSPSASPAQGAADPALEAAKRAFDALTENDRIALQDGLIWTGDYKGIADGKFGKGTRDAIAAFAARNTFPADGTLDTKGRATLAMAAKQAKDGVRFLVQTDPKTQIRLGLPLKLLTKTKPLATGTRYSSADESFSIETTALVSSLQDAYAATIAETPSRKVTYKVLRPDFFVVTGETGGKTFYTRMARGQRDGAAGLSGFTMTYPIAEKSRLDPISIAVANSFVPFPDPAAAAHTQTAAATSSAVVSGDTSAAKLALTASAVTVGPGLLLTILPKTCTEPLIQTKKAKIVKQGDADGLTLISLSGTPTATVSIRTGDTANQNAVTVLSYTAKSNTGSLGPGENLMAVSGDLHKAEAAGGWRLLASIQIPAEGAAVFDQNGALAGLVPMDQKPVTLIAGILPQMSRDLIPASKLTAFLASPGLKSAGGTTSRTTGEIVAIGGAAMLPVYCAR